MGNQPTASEEATAPSDPQSATSTPAKRGRRRWLLWLFLGLLAGVLVTGGTVFAITSSQKTKAASREDAFATAEAHYETAIEALSAVDTAQRVIETNLGDGFDEQFAKADTTLTEAIAKATPELESAQEAATAIEDEATRTALEKAIDLAKQAATELGEATEDLTATAPLMNQAQELDLLSTKIAEEIDDTIVLINKSKWPSATKKSETTRADIASAQKKIKQMEKLRLKLGVAAHGITAATEEMKLDKEMADVQSDLIDSGRSKTYSAYNKSIDNYNDLASEMDDIYLADFYDDPYVYLEGQLTSIEMAKGEIQRSKQSHTEAVEAFHTSESARE